MSLTCVSCYYNVKNKHDDQYFEWFKNTLNINCPYVFFSNKEGIEIIKKYRKYPTYYVELEIKDFYTYQYKDKILVHPIHCPSIELNLIWNEKIYMVQKAFLLNPFNSGWFKWIDAGICIYRDIYPPQHIFPNIEKLNQLPTNKFIFSSSLQYKKHLITPTNYYHYISGTYILHKNIIPLFIKIYTYYIDKLINLDNIWTDQVILTHIYNDNPSLFFKLCDGYGEITKYLM